MSRFCELAGCLNLASPEPLYACGIFYVCDPCRAIINEITLAYMDEPPDSPEAV
jgi:hypothetical protein